MKHQNEKRVVVATQKVLQELLEMRYERHPLFSSPFSASLSHFLCLGELKRWTPRVNSMKQSTRLVPGNVLSCLLIKLVFSFSLTHTKDRRILCCQFWMMCFHQRLCVINTLTNATYFKRVGVPISAAFQLLIYDKVQLQQMIHVVQTRSAL